MKAVAALLALFAGLAWAEPQKFSDGLREPGRDQKQRCEEEADLHVSSLPVRP